jgi:hypothetical protein
VNPLRHRQPWLDHEALATVRPLLESHDDFLAAGRGFRDRLSALAQGDGIAPGRRLRLTWKLEPSFREWQWAMECHERHEESNLYPLLAARTGLDPRGLIAEHADLDALAEATCVAFAALTAGLARGAASFTAAHAALDRYLTELERHLCGEEELVIPRLLALYSSPARSTVITAPSSNSIPRRTSRRPPSASSIAITSS